MRYYHLKQNVMGKFTLANPLIFMFLVKIMIIEDNRPPKKSDLIGEKFNAIA